MSDDYIDFRRELMPNDKECNRFRQLLVNSVIATDLFDAELKKFRENRWYKVFPKDSDDPSIGVLTNNNTTENDDDDTNLRATIVIEHIIQASDVSHTMQHWHVYQNWNQRLLEEMYKAYRFGRAEKDPTLGWYEGELWFFDNYIIPLAAKLKTCGVFGVSCDEFLNYAIDNRAEWALKGKDIVANQVDRLSEMYQVFEEDIVVEKKTLKGKRGLFLCLWSISKEKMKLESNRFYGKRSFVIKAKNTYTLSYIFQIDIF